MSSKNIDRLVFAIKECPEHFIRDTIYTQEQAEEISHLVNKLFHEDNLPNKEKGDLLEEFTKHVFEQHGLVEIEKNVRSSTNEIDLCLKLTKYGNTLNQNLYNNLIKSPYILVECKNISKAVDVTVVGKFSSLLAVSSCKLGLIVSRMGLSGRNNWDAAKGLVRKLNLKHQQLILDFPLNDFLDLANDNVFNLIESKQQSILLDTTIERIPHPLANDFQNESL